MDKNLSDHHRRSERGRPPARRRTPAPGAVDVVLALAWETWADMHRREFAFSVDRLFTHLDASPRVRRLLVANPWRSAPVRLARRVSARGAPRFPADAATSAVGPLRLRRADPTDPAALAAEYLRYDRRLAATARRRGLADPVLIATHPFHAALAGISRHWRRRVYYAWDDFAALPDQAGWRAAFDDAYRKISSSGMPVAAVAPAILRTIEPSGPGLVLPNGVEPAEWAAPPQLAPPTWFAALPRPVLLYTGTLGSRLDLDALAALAKAQPGASIALVGHASEPEYLAPLLAFDNVHVRGLHPRSAVIAMTFAADVCLLPHLSTPLTEAMSPLKLFEYLAAGRPVVAADLEPVRALGAAVRIARTPAEFVAEVAAALAGGPAGEAARLDFVARNAWSGRFEALLDVAAAPRDTAPRDGAPRETAAGGAHRGGGR